tara:strand:+ start:2385 stop:3041 length:657 start_codon:yes stop_codon:yes gene_type:complete
MFDDFKDDIMKEIAKRIPFVHCRILGKDKNYIKDTQSLHSFGCFTAMDLFKFSKEEKREMPAMFIIPYLRKGVSPRFQQFLDLGIKADVVVDEKPESEVGILHLICCFTDSKSKDMAGSTISRILTDVNARHYSFLSESWVVEQKKPYDGDRDCMPSEHPDKKEILMITTSDPSRNIMTMKDIQDDKLVGGKYHETKADVSCGRFANLFHYNKDKTIH